MKLFCILTAALVFASLHFGWVPVLNHVAFSLSWGFLAILALSAYICFGKK